MLAVEAALATLLSGLVLAALLAALESSLNPWTACWAKGTALAAGLDTSDGYHSIHTHDDDGHQIDDDHAEDSWCVVRQALTPERYDEIHALVIEMLDVCSTYADYHLELTKPSPDRAGQATSA